MPVPYKLSEGEKLLGEYKASLVPFIASMMIPWLAMGIFILLERTGLLTFYFKFIGTCPEGYLSCMPSPFTIIIGIVLSFIAVSLMYLPILLFINTPASDSVYFYLWILTIFGLPFLGTRMIYVYPVYGVATVFLVYYYARSFTYYTTNKRMIIVQSWTFGKEIRDVKYSRISDVGLVQSFFGRIFNYGSVVPVSIAGIGAGEKMTLARTVRGETIRVPVPTPNNSFFVVKNPMRVMEEVTEYVIRRDEVEKLDEAVKELKGMKDYLIKTIGSLSKKPQ